MSVSAAEKAWVEKFLKEKQKSKNPSRRTKKRKEEDTSHPGHGNFLPIALQLLDGRDELQQLLEEPAEGAMETRQDPILPRTGGCFQVPPTWKDVQLGRGV